MQTRPFLVRLALGLITSKYLWLLVIGAIVFLWVIKPAYWSNPDERDNRPPMVTRLTEARRIELNRFELAWLPSEDDTTPFEAISFDLGLVPSGVCVVGSPSVSVVGANELVLSLPDDLASGPIVGFTLRSLDEERSSYGYGPCRWSLRSPQRVAIDLPYRPPRIPQRRPGDRTSGCHSDGQGSVWCASASEVAHLDGQGWSIMALPPETGFTDWAALDADDILVQSPNVQLHVNRYAGSHLFILSPDNESFDGPGGVIRIGRESAYLTARGYVTEFSAGRLDLSGPPVALRLPQSCQRVLQIGYEGALAFALCQAGTSRLLFVGEANRRLMNWRRPFTIDLERVESIFGTPDEGMAAMTDEGNAALVSWAGENIEGEPLSGLDAEQRPFATLGGSPEHPLAFAGVSTALWANTGTGWEPVGGTPDAFTWAELEIPRHSDLVGTPRGVYAISPERTALLQPHGAEIILEHPRGVFGVRGRDARHYLVQSPSPRAVFSTRNGWEWYEHPLDPPFPNVTSAAVTSSGGIYLSGQVEDPANPGVTRPRLFRLGQEEIDLTPEPFLSARAPGVPLGTELPSIFLASDEQGRLYALSDSWLTWRYTDSPAWTEPILLDGEVSGIVGLTRSVLLMGSRNGLAALWRCVEGDCFLLPAPSELTGTPDALFAWGDGFCLGIDSSGLWCHDMQPSFFPVTFATGTAGPNALGPHDDWSIIDGLSLSEGVWLVAIETRSEGFLAQIGPGEPARLLARGLSWAEGEVLVRHADGVIYGIEVEGPFRMNLEEERFSVPGMVY